MRQVMLQRKAMLLLTLPFFFFFTACSSNTNDPVIEGDTSGNEILLRGALNVKFDNKESDYRADFNTISIEGENVLQIRVSALSDNTDDKEQALLICSVPVESATGLPEVGDYQFKTETHEKFKGNFSYERRLNSGDFFRFKFEGISLRLRINESQPDHLTGSFSFKARQEYGQRMMHGQLEDVNLANNGEINILVNFNAKKDS